jgi:hypothetical protein
MVNGQQIPLLGAFCPYARTFRTVLAVGELGRATKTPQSIFANLTPPLHSFLAAMNTANLRDETINLYSVRYFQVGNLFKVTAIVGEALVQIPRYSSIST